MKVSVVIPSRRQRILTLESVEAIKDYVDDINIVREGSTGEAMNIGAIQSKNNVLLFLDDDVHFTRLFFLNALEQLIANEESFIGLKTSDGMSFMFVLIRKEDFVKIGGIKLPNYYLDTEFLFRAKKVGFEPTLYSIDSVIHLSPTPSGFWSRRQRLLSFHSCYVYLKHRDFYTENFGKMKNIKLSRFIFRFYPNPWRALYRTLILLAGIFYYGILVELLLHTCKCILIRFKNILLFYWHKFVFISPLSDYLRFRKLKKMLSNLDYEPTVSQFLKEQHGDIFVDVGANIGYYSILLSKNFNVVYAFEPFPSTYKTLCSYLKRLKINNVVPLRNAIMATGGTSKLGVFDYFIQKDDPTTHIQLGLPEPNHVPNELINVQASSLASYFPVARLDLVKVDVEGYEGAVLRGAIPIMDRIKAWLIEVHNLELRKDFIEKFLKTHGYRIKWLDSYHVFATRT